MQDPIEILTVSERVDAADVPQLRRILWDLAIERRFRVVVNLAAVEWLSFEASELLALTARVSRANGGDLVLSSPSSALRTTILLSLCEAVVRVFDSDEEAARYFDFGDGGDGALVPALRLPPRPGLRARAVPEQ